MRTYKKLFIVLIPWIISSIYCSGAATARYLSDDTIKVIEKVYLHTDRDNYYSGDDIWFKAYLVEASGNLPSEISKSLHVELIAPSSEIICSGIISIEDGSGEGEFRLSDSIKSGRYRLRAYTNYMRNFDDLLFFTKEIIIVNPSIKNGVLSDNIRYLKKGIHLDFFPEGGSLIDNVTSKVAFKATNELGRGCDVAGRVFSSAGDLVATFRSTHKGMGIFFLRPMPGLSYYSICRGSDSLDIRTDLPTSIPVGVNLSVSQLQGKDLLVTAKTNRQTLETFAGHDLTLCVLARKEVLKMFHFNLKEELAGFSIPTGDLPDGIIQLSISVTGDLPLSERLVYIQKKCAPSLVIKTGKSIYHKREHVQLNVSVSGDSACSDDANISISVVQKKFTDNSSDYPRNISSWFLLESDVKGFVEDPSYYFDPANTERLKDLDLLLLTQGWRDFAWKYDSGFFPPEKGFSISGRLKRIYSKKSIEDSHVCIGIFEKNRHYVKTVQTDSTGRFRLIDLDLEGDARLIVSGLDKKNNYKGLLVMDSLGYLPAPVTKLKQTIQTLNEDDSGILKTSYEINEAIKKKFRLSDTITLGEVKIISEKHKDLQMLKVESSRLMYGTPTYELKITEEMKQYPFLVEILRSRVTGIVVTGSFPDYKITCGAPNSLKGVVSPLILIDGNPASLDDLITYPINFVDRIDILKGAAASIFGLSGSGGVINIITKVFSLIPDKPLSYSVNYKIKGYDIPMVFYSPQHVSDSDSIYNPDFRATLFWNPHIEIKKDETSSISFYNGDDISVIKIIAEGMTMSGIPVAGKAEYEVR